jgi:Amt family ammonium transporter
MGTINGADTALVLVSAAFVFIMTPGLAFFYGGLARRKNMLSLMLQSFIAMGLVAVVWFFGGFSLAFGHDIGGIIGGLEFFGLRGVGMAPSTAYARTIPFLVFFLYQMMFVIITPALITGGFAGRMKFATYLVFLALWVLLVYVPVAHWSWGIGGWMQHLGFVDFAGGVVVHVTAGAAALASVFAIGKRKVAKNESLAPSNIMYVALGTALLWFGWFGFNGGSAFAANGIAARAWVNTMLCAATAMMVWLFAGWFENRRFSAVAPLVGAVVGLVAITPSAGYVLPWAAVTIGVIVGLICFFMMGLIHKLHVDDALDVFACHGTGGVAGSILVGVFAQKSVNGISGLIEGNWRQFGVQVLGVVVCFIFSFVVTMLILKVMNAIRPIRVSEAVEAKGLDMGEFGEQAY